MALKRINKVRAAAVGGRGRRWGGRELCYSEPTDGARLGAAPAPRRRAGSARALSPAGRSCEWCFAERQQARGAGGGAATCYRAFTGLRATTEAGTGCCRVARSALARAVALFAPTHRISRSVAPRGWAGRKRRQGVRGEPRAVLRGLVLRSPRLHPAAGDSWHAGRDSL